MNYREEGFVSYISNVYSDNAEKPGCGIELARAGLVARGATTAEIRAAMLNSPYSAMKFAGTDLKSLFTLF